MQRGLLLRTLHFELCTLNLLLCSECQAGLSGVPLRGSSRFSYVMGCRRELTSVTAESWSNSDLNLIFMTSRYLALAAAFFAFVCTSPLVGQQFSPSSILVLTPSAEAQASTLSSSSHRTDPRLLVSLSKADSVWADQPEFVSLSAAFVQPRPRWQYPLLGAIIGGVAGGLYAHIRYSGESAFGWPFDPVLVFAPLGAAAGALIGAIVDESVRR